MFDLEQSILEWRKEMLAAGLKAPVLLDELESHLREEVEANVSAGIDPREVFEAAIHEIGQIHSLKIEFAMAGGIHGWFDEEKAVRSHHTLGALWTLFCLWELIPTAWLLSHMSKTAVYLPERMMIIPIFAIIVDLAGIYGGICLLLGVKLGRPIIRVVAAAVAIIIVANLADFRSRGPAWSILFVSGFLVVFCLTTIWLFRSPRKPKLATK